MIGKVMRGRGFGGLARYLETGRDANNPDRVAWTDARNLPTDDPYTASLLMRATAAQSVRTEKPVYHIAISFDPDDAVDRATMVLVADRLLSDLQLQDHQALIVAHGDTHQPHRAAALQAAPKLVHSGSEHVRRVREAWTNRAEHRQAKTRVTHLEGQIKRLDAELDRSPGRAQLEHRLARQLRELQPPQRRTLHRSLPIPHRKLLAAATMIGREFAREQGHEM